MDFFGILAMVGGLALFLYGMDLMGEGLAKASGGKMEKMLETLTSNTLKAVALGAIVTAVIQSSSATTVIVVGFVNSGIMKLEQAELYAIRWHMGFTDSSIPANINTLSMAIDKYPIIWALHNADMIASHFMEDTEGNLPQFDNI